MSLFNTRSSPATWRDDFPSRSQADHFWQLFVSRIPGALGPIGHENEEAGEIHLENGGVVNVANPARDIRTVPRFEWAEYISWWLECLRQQSQQVEQAVRTWKQAKRALRVRLLPNVFGATMIHLPMGESLSWGVALDLPAGSSPAPLDGIERWGQDLETIWETASRNTARQLRIERTDVIAAQRHLRLLESDSLFTTGALDDLRLLVPEIGRGGALAIAPTSYSLLVQPIDGWTDVAEDAIRLVVAACEYGHDQSHALPPTVVWYREPGLLAPAFELRPQPGRPWAINILAPEPLRSALDPDPIDPLDDPFDDGPCAA